MTTVTLEAVKAEHAKLAALIAQFEAQQSTTYLVPETVIAIASGERYAGIVLDAEGGVAHHLVLLPGAAEDVSWDAATEWAATAGGELPTRQEQALLYANLRGEFESSDWYWSSEIHANDGSYAWNQYFDYGHQNYTRKSYEGRARAVRRFKA